MGGLGERRFGSADLEAELLPMVRSDQARMVLRHWMALWDDAHLPLKTKLDPAAIARALPYVWLVERYDDDFVYRLAGNDVEKTFRQSLRGRSIRSVFDADFATGLGAVWTDFLDRPAVAYQSAAIYKNGTTTRTGERVTFPLNGESGLPAFIFGVTVLDDRDADTKPLPTETLQSAMGHMIFPLRTDA